jgi:hypothetical protein
MGFAKGPTHPASYGSQLLIHKLPTIPTAATPATVTPTAAPADVATAATAPRRRRRRRNPDATATAAAAAAPTDVVPTATAIKAAAVRAATPSAATPATRTDVSRTIAVALCFGVGGNGCSSECEGRCEHGGYPAQLQQHDTSPSIFIRGRTRTRIGCIRTETSNEAQIGKLEESMHPIATISRDMVNARTVVSPVQQPRKRPLEAGVLSTCPPKLEERRRKSEGGSRDPPSRNVHRRITPIGPRFARTDGLQSVLHLGCIGPNWCGRSPSETVRS